MAAGSTAVALPEAWQSDARPTIPGDVIRTVAGLRVHHFADRDWLSTSTVLSLTCWGRVEHVPPAALEYGATRGTYVDQACRWDDEGVLDYDALCPALRGYVDGWRKFRVEHAPVILGVEELITNKVTGTFGYCDRRVLLDDAPTILDVKTSAMVGQRYAYQLADYARPTERRMVIQLAKDGTYQIHEFTDGTDFERWVWLCEEAWRYIREEETRPQVRRR